MYLITIKNGTYAIGAALTKEEALAFAQEESDRKRRPIRVEYKGEIIWSNYKK